LTKQIWVDICDRGLRCEDCSSLTRKELFSTQLSITLP